METPRIHPGLVASHQAATHGNRQAARIGSNLIPGLATDGHRIESTSRINTLVAGSVSSGINRGAAFDGPLPPSNPEGSLQIYGSRAERMEAATLLAAGRILDTTA